MPIYNRTSVNVSLESFSVSGNIELNICFHAADRLLEGGEQMTRRKQPAPNDVQTLGNWFKKGFLARDERRYLNYMDGLDDSLDLMSLHTLPESDMNSLGTQIQRLLAWTYTKLKKVCSAQCLSGCQSSINVD